MAFSASTVDLSVPEVVFPLVDCVVVVVVVVVVAFVVSLAFVAEVEVAEAPVSVLSPLGDLDG